MSSIGYRTETYRGSGYRFINDVLHFEIFELGNTDILYTIIENNLVSDNDKSFIDELLCDIRNDCMYDESLEEEIIYQIVRKIKTYTGINIKYCLWLADKDIVSNPDNYGEFVKSPYDIDAYEIGKIVLSDLGEDGKLYAYEEMPVKVVTDS